jgi:hypothetical protein
MKRPWYRKKRTWVTAIMILYVISKIYVSFTQSKIDDDLPDRVRDVLLRLVMIDPNAGIS